VEDHVNNLQEDVRRTVLSQHIVTLKSYARKALVNAETLTPEEDKDRQIRIRELMSMGDSFGLTSRQMVAHLYKGLLKPPSMCKCPDCR
jgi:hypothetical protein